MYCFAQACAAASFTCVKMVFARLIKAILWHPCSQEAVKKFLLAAAVLVAYASARQSERRRLATNPAYSQSAKATRSGRITSSSLSAGSVPQTYLLTVQMLSGRQVELEVSSSQSVLALRRLAAAALDLPAGTEVQLLLGQQILEDHKMLPECAFGLDPVLNAVAFAPPAVVRVRRTIFAGIEGDAVCFGCDYCSYASDEISLLASETLEDQWNLITPRDLRLETIFIYRPSDGRGFGCCNPHLDVDWSSNDTAWAVWTPLLK